MTTTAAPPERGRGPREYAPAFGLERERWEIPRPAAGRWRVDWQGRAPALYWIGQSQDVEHAIQPFENLMQTMRLLRAVSTKRAVHNFRPVPRRMLNDGNLEFFVASLAPTGRYRVRSATGALEWDDDPREPRLEFEVQDRLIELATPSAPQREPPPKPRRKLREQPAPKPRRKLRV